MGQGGSTQEEQAAAPAEGAGSPAKETPAPAAPEEAPPTAGGGETAAAPAAADAGGEEVSGKTGKGKRAKGEGKSKEGKGKSFKGKEGKDASKGADAKGKGKEKGKGKDKGAVKGSGPTAGGSGYRLNVKNLGKMTEEELKKLFEPFGEVSMCEIKKGDRGESRGFGFVVLPGEKEGEEAAKEMSGKEVNGLKLNVAAAERRAPTEEGGKGKGKMDMASAQAMYAQQWAAYSQMMYMQHYAAYAQQQSMWAKSAAAEQEFEGSLKSISSRNGYGFIVCRETYEIFGRDVYVDKDILPEGAERGSRLSFTVQDNDKGHPKAVTCKMAPSI